MSYTLSPITLTENVTSLVNIPGDLAAVSFVKLTNASPYLILLTSILGGQDYLQPGECNIWAVPGLTSAIQATPLPFISGTTASPSSVLVVTWYGVGESPQGTAYPINFNTLSFVGNTVATNAITNAVTPVYNVQAYGAKGDGVTDDRAAIQAALDAARGTPGTVYLPAGTYLLASTVTAQNNTTVALIVSSGTLFQGAGRDATTLKFGTGLPDLTRGIVNYNNASPGGDTNITLADFTLDGNNVNQSSANAQSGIWFQFTQGVTLERVRLRNLYGTGSSGAAEGFYCSIDSSSNASLIACEAVCTTGNSSSGFSANYSTNVRYTDCDAHGMTHANGFTHYGCDEVSYVGCVAYSNAVHGFNTEVSLNITYANCVSGILTASQGGFNSYPFSSGQQLGNTTNGWTLHGSQQVYLVNCVAQYNGNDGAFIQLASTEAINSRYVVISGGAFNSNAGRGIELDANATGYVRLIGSVRLSGNTTAACQVYVNGALTTVNLTSQQSVNPTLPASGVAVLNPLPCDALVSITGGTVTAIAVNGNTIATTTPQMVWLPAEYQISVTYSVAPTWTWHGRL